MAVAQPTIVVIPGAFHATEHYADLVARLDRAGYPVLMTSLPSSYEGVPGSSAAVELHKLSKASPEEGRKVLGLICISAFFLKEGTEVHKLDPPPFAQV